MADRFVLKQFAGSATNNGAFGAAQATGAGVQPVANIKDVQSLNAFEQGWNSATLTADKLPALEEMQGLEALLCKAIKENYSEGIPFWISGETYYQYSFVNYNGIIYYNTTGSYTANNPAIDTANWAAYNKVGTATVGTDDTPIYLNVGTPTAGKRMGVVAYDNIKTYNLDDVVLNVDSNGVVELYLSLAASNTSALTDTTKWKKVSSANVDLSNLTATGENHFANPALTNTPYTTNRILEIPQDIKLELSNGTLTLKAGSKVYDGNNNSFSITSDITKSGLAGGDVQQLLLLKIDGTTLISVGVTDTSFAYNSSTGYVHSNTYGDYYLPIALISHNTGTGVYTSIDQIFNGFGYIGSTVFVLPGKYAFADGKEDDGTYKTIMWENTDVLTFQTTTPDYLFRILLDYDNQNLICPAEGTFGTGKRRVWDADKNIWTLDGVKHHYLEVGSFVANTTSPYNIISFKTSSVDCVANSNASNFSQAGRSYLSGLGAVSSNSEVTSLALGASGTTYTAPSTGYVRLRATSGNYLGIIISGVGAYQSVPSNTTLHFWSVLLKKGTQYSIEYNGTLTNHTFISADGEN